MGGPCSCLLLPAYHAAYPCTYKCTWLPAYLATHLPACLLPSRQFFLHCITGGQSSITTAYQRK